MSLQGIYEVVDNKKLTENVYKITVSGDTSAIKFAGQFCNIKIENLFLRRPISVCDVDDTTITMIYKVVGSGTEILSKKSRGDKLDLLVGLGNGYTITNQKVVTLIGGGVGVPPLYLLAKKLIENGVKPKVLLGFNTANEIILDKDFTAIGLDVTVCTVDGSVGVKGFVTEAIKEKSYVYACGAEPMLKAVYGKCLDGQFSFEARMACGFGACMGCTCATKYGAKRICKDGPVLEYKEIIW